MGHRSPVLCVSGPVMLYGSRDRHVLPTALSFLHASSDTLLCPGTSLAIPPDGKILYIRSQRGSPDYDWGFYEKSRSKQYAVSEKRVSASQDSDPFYQSGSPALAHLPFGFHVDSPTTILPFTMSFLTGDMPTRGTPSRANNVYVDELNPPLLPFHETILLDPALWRL